MPTHPTDTLSLTFERRTGEKLHSVTHCFAMTELYLLGNPESVLFDKVNELRESVDAVATAPQTERMVTLPLAELEGLKHVAAAAIDFVHDCTKQLLMPPVATDLQSVDAHAKKLECAIDDLSDTLRKSLKSAGD